MKRNELGNGPFGKLSYVRFPFRVLRTAAQSIDARFRRGYSSAATLRHVSRGSALSKREIGFAHGELIETFPRADGRASWLGWQAVVSPAIRSYGFIREGTGARSRCIGP